MSATMARQGGRVQLEQSDMHLTLNMAKIANRGFACAMIDKTQHLIKKPRTEVKDEKTWGVELPRHRKVKAAMERHPAMVYDNRTDSCLPCQNSTTKNPRTCWEYPGTGAPPQVRLKQPTPGLMPPPPSMPPAPTGDNIQAQSSKIQNLPTGYEYKHASLPGAEFFTIDTYAEASQHEEDFIPDLRNDDGTFTG